MSKNSIKLWFRIEEGYHRTDKVQLLIERGGLKAFGAYIWLCTEALSSRDGTVAIRTPRLTKEWGCKVTTVTQILDLILSCELAVSQTGSTSSESVTRVVPELCPRLSGDRSETDQRSSAGAPEIDRRCAGDQPEIDRRSTGDRSQVNFLDNRPQQNQPLTTPKIEKKIEEGEEEKRRKKKEGEGELDARAREATQISELPPPPIFKKWSAEEKGSVEFGGVRYGYHRAAEAWLEGRDLRGVPDKLLQWEAEGRVGYLWTWWDFVPADQVREGAWIGADRDADTLDLAAHVAGFLPEAWSFGCDGKLWAGEDGLIRDTPAEVRRWQVAGADVERAVGEVENFIKRKGGDAAREANRAGVAMLKSWMGKPMWNQGSGKKGPSLVGEALKRVGVGASIGQRKIA